MRTHRLSVAALLAMSAMGGPAIAAASASASSLIPVAFINVSATPTTISYGNNTVTVTGRLVEYLDQSVGVPDEQVSIEPYGTDAVLGSATTDADGDFTATATLSSGMTIQMYTAGDGTYGSAPSNLITIQASPQTPVVTLDPQPKSLVWAGSTVTFTGTAKVTVNGVAQPLADAKVELYLYGENAGFGSTTTAADGTFSFPVSPAAGGSWTAEVSPGTYSLYGYGTSNQVTLNVQHETQIENVSLPASAEVHGLEYYKGTVQESDAATWISASEIWVHLYYRTSSTGPWIAYGEAETDSAGAFSASLSLAVGTKQVQARVLKQTAGDVDLASDGPVKTIKMDDQTCFTGLGVDHSGGDTFVAGRVVDFCGSKNQTFATVTGSVQVYFRKNASSPWTHLGDAKLGQGGTAVYSRAGHIDGDFYFLYPQQGYFLKSQSVALYLGG